MVYKVYTDGSYLQSSNSSGLAFIIRTVEDLIAIGYSPVQDTSIHTIEAKAVDYALNYLYLTNMLNEGDEVHLCTDRKLLIQRQAEIQNNNLIRVKNIDIIVSKKIQYLLSLGIKIKWVHVVSHSEQRNSNVHVDRLAVACAGGNLGVCNRLEWRI